MEEYIPNKSAQVSFEKWYTTNYSNALKEKPEGYDYVMEDKAATYKDDKLQELLDKYENKELKGDFLMYEVYFYNILDPRLTN